MKFQPVDLRTDKGGNIVFIEIASISDIFQSTYVGLLIFAILNISELNYEITESPSVDRILFEGRQNASIIGSLQPLLETREVAIQL